MVPYWAGFWPLFSGGERDAGRLCLFERGYVYSKPIDLVQCHAILNVKTDLLQTDKSDSEESERHNTSN
jgi:hypothetical protein